MPRHDHRGRRPIVDEGATGADHARWQRTIGCIAQLCTRVTEDCTAHIESIPESEGADEITRADIDVLNRERPDPAV